MGSWTVGETAVVKWDANWHLPGKSALFLFQSLPALFASTVFQHRNGSPATNVQKQKFCPTLSNLSIVINFFSVGFNFCPSIVSLTKMAPNSSDNSAPNLNWLTFSSTLELGLYTLCLFFGNAFLTGHWHTFDGPFSRNPIYSKFASYTPLFLFKVFCTKVHFAYSPWIDDFWWCSRY
mgnify:CR=1 FL=1